MEEVIKCLRIFCVITRVWEPYSVKETADLNRINLTTGGIPEYIMFRTKDDRLRILENRVRYEEALDNVDKNIQKNAEVLDNVQMNIQKNA